jgi:hypothetical protein
MRYDDEIVTGEHSHEDPELYRARILELEKESIEEEATKNDPISS